MNGEEKRWFYNDEHKVEAIALNYMTVLYQIFYIIGPLSQIATLQQLQYALLFILLFESINFESQNNL